MKLSIFFATLALAFGMVASGCGESKSKKAKSGGNTPTCEAGQTYSSFYNQCLAVSSCGSGQAIIPGTNNCGPINPGTTLNPNQGQLKWIHGNLNVTNGDKFAAFIESYGYTSYGQAFCVDNDDDLNIYAGYNWFGFPTIGLNFNFGLWGTQNCNTYDGLELWIGFNKTDIAVDDSTLAQVFFRVESTGAIIDLKLPHDAQWSTVKRANQDTEFAIQGYLYKLVHPQDWAYWRVRGNSIDVNASNGASVSIEWDGAQIATSNTQLFVQ